MPGAGRPCRWGRAGPARSTAIRPEVGGWTETRPVSLGLLPSGPDPVGEWCVHRQPPGAYLDHGGMRLQGGGFPFRPAGGDGPGRPIRRRVCFSGAGVLEGRQRLARSFRLQQPGKSRDVDPEPPGVGELGHETDIGERRLAPKQNGPGSAATSLSQASSPSAFAAFRPACHLFLGYAERTQPGEHLQILAPGECRRRWRRRRRARAHAGKGPFGSSGGFGWVSSSHSMIASDWVSTRPSSVSSVGSKPCGLSARYVGRPLLALAQMMRRDARPSGPSD